MKVLGQDWSGPGVGDTSRERKPHFWDSTHPETCARRSPAANQSHSLVSPSESSVVTGERVILSSTVFVSRTVLRTASREALELELVRQSATLYSDFFSDLSCQL